MFDWYYLSFATNEDWLGSCFVRQYNAEAAYFTATLKGLNPGGEVLITPLPEIPKEIVAPYAGRLLNKADLRELDVVLGGDGTLTTDIEERRRNLGMDDEC